MVHELDCWSRRGRLPPTQITSFLEIHDRGETHRRAKSHQVSYDPAIRAIIPANHPKKPGETMPILMICGDYSEDYEVMMPFQALLVVGHQVHAVCQAKRRASRSQPPFMISRGSRPTAKSAATTSPSTRPSPTSDLNPMMRSSFCMRRRRILKGEEVSDFIWVRATDVRIDANILPGTVD